MFGLQEPGHGFASLPENTKAADLDIVLDDAMGSRLTARRPPLIESLPQRPQGFSKFGEVTECLARADSLQAHTPRGRGLRYGLTCGPGGRNKPAQVERREAR